MQRNICRIIVVLSALLLPPALPLLATAQQAAKDGHPFVRFETKELTHGLGVGYAVRLVDVDNDGKKDIVVVDRTRVVWYQNPTWKRRIIIENQTKPDNVCIAPYDIDGDGKIDFALGADWGGLNTKSGGTIQWLKRGKSLDEKWTVYPITEEPTVHRIRFANVDGKGKSELIITPLMGRGSSGKKNWMNGHPVRTIALHIPKDPTSQRWTPEILNENLHVVHNFWPIQAHGRKGQDLLIVSYEGVSKISRTASGKWTTRRLGKGNQENPGGKRGASEIKLGKLKNGARFIAVIEPWHGNQVVVYTSPAKKGQMWNRHVIDDHLRWGHAVWCEDLDGDGSDELIIGVRDEPQKNDKFTERRGIRIYKARDGKGAHWQRQIIDNGGIACEDLVVDDINGDGRPDIVAVGRQTHNMRIYWNKTPQVKK